MKFLFIVLMLCSAKDVCIRQGWPVQLYMHDKIFWLLRNKFLLSQLYGDEHSRVQPWGSSEYGPNARHSFGQGKTDFYWTWLACGSITDVPLRGQLKASAGPSRLSGMRPSIHTTSWSTYRAPGHSQEGKHWVRHADCSFGVQVIRQSHLGLSKLFLNWKDYFTNKWTTIVHLVSINPAQLQQLSLVNNFGIAPNCVSCNPRKGPVCCQGTDKT